MIANGIYQHYKGGMYEVIGVSINTETKEELVVYKKLHKPQLYTRPVEMWEQIVNAQGEVSEAGKIRFRWVRLHK